MQLIEAKAIDGELWIKASDSSAACKESYMAGVKSGIEAEREACAKVCDALGEDMKTMAQWGADNCAAAIRARSNT